MTHVAILLGIIVIAGALGGLVRHSVTRADGSGRLSPLAHVGLGILAAALVPLSLEMAASRVIDETSASPRYYLVFAGLCLLFSYSAERSVEKLTSKVLQQLETKTADLEEKATQAAEQAQAAEKEAVAATAQAAVSAGTKPAIMLLGPEGGGGLVDTQPAQVLDDLAAKYDAIRASERGRPSADRTRRMTELFVAMTRVFGEHRDAVPIVQYLTSPHPNHGKRLVGFAACHENPDPTQVEVLINAIKTEDKPFGQYWGLRALERVAGSLDRKARSLALAFVDSQMSQSSLRGTDRYHVLRSISEQLRTIP